MKARSSVISISSAENALKSSERNLKSAGDRHLSATKKVDAIQKDIDQTAQRAERTTSEGLLRNYQNQLTSKQRRLGAAREEVSRRLGELRKAEAKVKTAESKLREEEKKERDREERQEKQERRRAKQADQREREKQEREQRLADLARNKREADQDQRLETLQSHAGSLEERLLAAERRAAPPEVTVLFLASSPEDQDVLRLDRETREIQKRLRTADFRDSIWIEWRLARQVADLLDDLNEVDPTVLHFSGHGSDAELVFEDADATSHGLSNDQLASLLGAGAARVRLIVFNSCDSAVQAELATKHVDLAIGMDTAIDDDDAKVFAGQLYNSLAFGKSVGEAFRQAKFQLEAHGSEGAEIPRLFHAEGVDADHVILVSPD
jgi:myosin heavy subunit